MPTESWHKHKYLFVRDLDRDGWDLVNDFYNKCKLYDQSVEYNNSFFKKNEEQIRVNLVRVIADYAKEFHAESQRPDYDKAVKEFSDMYMRGQKAWYSPQKPILDARRHLTNLNENLSQSAVGIKLRAIAKIKV